MRHVQADFGRLQLTYENCVQDALHTLRHLSNRCKSGVTDISACERKHTEADTLRDSGH